MNDFIYDVVDTIREAWPFFLLVVCAWLTDGHRMRGE